MELGLKGKVALVTGGSRGIGRLVSERLADAGADVVINYLRDERAAEEVRAYAERAGVRAVVARGEVSRLEDAERVVSAAVEEFGRLDLVVCNAGVWEGAAVDALDEALWDRVLDVNLKGTWTVCRAAVPHMKRAGAGKIVIVSSTAGQRGEANVSNYAASKGGQISFCKSLAAELGAFGINVNAVAPGWVDTEMSADVLEDEGQRRAIERSIPLGRVATAEDIALPIIFLCTDWARHITGEVLNINGGSVLCG